MIYLKRNAGGGRHLRLDRGYKISLRCADSLDTRRSNRYPLRKVAQSRAECDTNELARRATQASPDQ
jgi:hypothetical protein